MVLRSRECEDAEPLHAEKQLLGNIRARHQAHLLLCIVMTWKVDSRGRARAFKYDAESYSCEEVRMPVTKTRGNRHRVLDFRQEDGTLELAEVLEKIELDASPLRPPVSRPMPSKNPRPELQCDSVSLPSMVKYVIQKMKKDNDKGWDRLRRNMMKFNRTTVRLGTACSGTDVVVLIWKAFFKAMEAEGVYVKLQHVFSCKNM